MFTLSQLALRSCGLNYPLYAVVIGTVIYAGIYLAFLYYSPSLFNVFNNVIIYIIGVDLLGAAFLYYTNLPKDTGANTSPKITQLQYSNESSLAELDTDSDSDESGIDIDDDEADDPGLDSCVPALQFDFENIRVIPISIPEPASTLATITEIAEAEPIEEPIASASDSAPEPPRKRGRKSKKSISPGYPDLE